METATALRKQTETENDEFLLLLTKWAQARMHPWPFLRHFCFTFDPHEPNLQFKRFPNKLLYRIIAEVWYRENLVAFPKTRQMMISWIMAALQLWDTMFGTRQDGEVEDPRGWAYNKYSYAQSKKEEDANRNIVERQKRIYKKLMQMGLPDLPRMKPGPGGGLGSFCHAEFPDTESHIFAVPQGEDVLRSNTASNVLWDEAAFQPLARLGYEAIKPTVSSYGRLALVSTPNGHEFFHDMVFDVDDNKQSHGVPVLDSRNHALKILTKIQPDSEEEEDLLNMPQSEFAEIPLVELCAAVDGLDYWVNRDNGFHVLRIHYSADPDKSPKTVRGREWIERERRGMNRSSWEREYEINFDTWSGRSVIDNWRRDWFVSADVQFDPSLTLYSSCDLGTDVACTFYFQKHNIQGVTQIQFLDETHLTRSHGMNPTTMILGERFQDKISAEFPEAWETGNHKMFPDANDATKSRTTSIDTDEEILRRFGAKTFIRKLDVRKSTDFVRMQFNYNNGVAGVLIHPRCQYLIACVSGGWHYPEDCRDGKPEHDGVCIHGGDAIRYGICNAVRPKELVGVFDQVPNPRRSARIIRDITGRRRATLGFKAKIPRWR